MSTPPMEKTLAKCIQDSLNTRSLPSPRPRVHKGNGSYYILKRSEGTTVIVECGFLSNPQEEEKLGSRRRTRIRSYRQCLMERWHIFQRRMRVAETSPSARKVNNGCHTRSIFIPGHDSHYALFFTAELPLSHTRPVSGCLRFHFLYKDLFPSGAG